MAPSSYNSGYINREASQSWTMRHGADLRRSDKDASVYQYPRILPPCIHYHWLWSHIEDSFMAPPDTTRHVRRELPALAKSQAHAKVKTIRTFQRSFGTRKQNTTRKDASSVIDYSLLTAAYMSRMLRHCSHLRTV